MPPTQDVIQQDHSATALIHAKNLESLETEIQDFIQYTHCLGTATTDIVNSLI